VRLPGKVKGTVEGHTDRVIKFGGEGGEGVLSCGEMLSLALARAGYEIFTLQVIPAEIKGGACNILVRADIKPIYSAGEDLDALVCFNEEAFTLLGKQLKPGGLLIYDPVRFQPQGDGFVPYPIQLEFMAVQEVKSALSKNVVGMGALASVLGVPYDLCEEFVKTRKKWIKKGQPVIDRNVHALQLGYNYVRDNPPPVDLKMAPPQKPAGERIVVPGNDMITMGAIASGLKFYAGYPITPASTILEKLEHWLPKFGGFAIQTEDEIAAITAVIGASFAGSKAMTATSGPGVALMNEALGLATMTETPLVLVDVMRGGPSTGLPTKTEQSDLNVAVYGGHGDAPRIVLAAASVEGCFYTACDAFNLAEKYQMPVILLSDYSLSTCTQAIPKPAFDAVKPVNRQVPSTDDLKAGYRRYKPTPNGVSPMAAPGMAGGQYTATGLEHSETGSPLMTSLSHRTMTDKRFKKVAEVSKEPGYLRRFGAAKARIGVICWGTTTGPVREAVEQAGAQGLEVAALHVRMLFPIPVEVGDFIASVETVLMPELNYSGQFAQMVRAKYLAPVVQLNKYDGLPFRASEILSKIKELAAGPRPAAVLAKH